MLDSQKAQQKQDQIKERLEVALVQAQQLKDDHERAVLEAVESGNQEYLTKIHKDCASLLNEIADLEVAYRAAETRTDQIKREEIAAANKRAWRKSNNALKQCESLIDEVLELGLQLSQKSKALIEKAKEAYQTAPLPEKDAGKGRYSESQLGPDQLTAAIRNDIRRAGVEWAVPAWPDDDGARLTSLRGILEGVKQSYSYFKGLQEAGECD